MFIYVEVPDWARIPKICPVLIVELDLDQDSAKDSDQSVATCLVHFEYLMDPLPTLILNRRQNKQKTYGYILYTIGMAELIDFAAVDL